MAKEILVYTPLFSFTTAEFVRELEAAKNENITIRINSGGGGVFNGYAMISKMKEHTGEITTKVDGLAGSMAAFFLLYSSNTEGSSLSKYLIHRADAFVDSDDERAALKKINDELRAKMEETLDEAKFKKITGKTFDDIFALDGRAQAFLNADEAKAIGLIQKINVVDVNATAESEWMFNVAATVEQPPAPIIPPAPITTPESKLNSNSMTLEELKSKHPEAFALAFGAGETAERDRAGAWMVYADADAKAVAEGIKGGKPLTATIQAELNRKLVSAAALVEEEADAADDIAEGAEGSEAAKAVAKAEAVKKNTPEAKAKAVKVKSNAVFMDEFRAESGIEIVKTE